MRIAVCRGWAATGASALTDISLSTCCLNVASTMGASTIQLITERATADGMCEKIVVS